MAVDEPDKYILNESWLFQKKFTLTNKPANNPLALPKSRFLSEMNLYTGRRYSYYKECFWSQSSQNIGWIPVYLFPDETHARAFLSRTKEKSTSYESYLASSPVLAADEPYETLGVDRKATRKQIKQAFREQVRRLHPDAGGDPDEFRALVEAFNALMAR